MKTSLKLEKSRAKSTFTRLKNKLIFLVESEGIGTSREVQEACDNLDTSLERTMDVMTRLSGHYMKNKEREKAKKVALETDKLEEDYNSAYDVARHYLCSLKGEQSSGTSEILAINLLNRMNIDDNSGAYQKQESACLQETSKKVGFSNSIDYNHGLESVKDTGLTTRIGTESHYSETQQRNAGIMSWVANSMTTPKQDEEHQENCSLRPEGNQTTMNAQAVPFEPAASYTAPSIGHDMWRQLKRVEIPTFSGDKKNYQSWKAAFLSCIDSAPATGEYKLLQLRKYLSGDALKVVDSLGHSATAYEAAKVRLERDYGGRRRQIAIYLEELDQFRQIGHGRARDIEEFADLLDIAMINLKEAGQDYELRDGSLYTKLQRKLPETMLTQYHRWIFENRKDESVMTLRTWVLQEAEFRTIASETVHGLTGRMSNNATARSITKYENQRTFFGEIKDKRSVPKLTCRECGKQHGIWSCRIFAQRSVRDRWNVAKRLQLCYRCLGEDHQGKSCPRSRTCGLDGCVDMHHRLLHKQKTVDKRTTVNDQTEVKRTEDDDTTRIRHAGQDNISTDQATFLTEGNDPAQETTMMVQSCIKPEFVALRTVPVILINGDSSIIVTALLNDASMTYVNAYVAAELGLQGRTERVNVNVLNGQIETFETK
ncbi:MAG: DUF1759 domain-containing protein, partial [Candidatus Thiodiazotropha taylori]|nr:DUF1759 domain-containing protein [Candidatus Thiodiazotropha taylori]